MDACCRSGHGVHLRREFDDECDDLRLPWRLPVAVAGVARGRLSTVQPPSLGRRACARSGVHSLIAELAGLRRARWVADHQAASNVAGSGYDAASWPSDPLCERDASECLTRKRQSGVVVAVAATDLAGGDEQRRHRGRRLCCGLVGARARRAELGFCLWRHGVLGGMGLPRPARRRAADIAAAPGSCVAPALGVGVVSRRV
jgi:hypothetical protein